MVVANERWRATIRPVGTEQLCRVPTGRADMVMDFGYQQLVATRLATRFQNFIFGFPIADSRLLIADSPRHITLDMTLAGYREH